MQIIALMLIMVTASNKIEKIIDKWNIINNKYKNIIFYIIFCEVCIYVCMYFSMSFMAGQTAGPIAIKFTELEAQKSGLDFKLKNSEKT